MPLREHNKRCAVTLAPKENIKKDNAVKTLIELKKKKKELSKLNISLLNDLMFQIVSRGLLVLGKLLKTLRQALVVKPIIPRVSTNQPPRGGVVDQRCPFGATMQVPFGP